MNHTELPGIGDCSSDWHRSAEALDQALHALPPAPRDVGTVKLIVRRPATGKRQMLDSALLTVANGIPGDAWNAKPDKKYTTQLAVINSEIAEIIANGQPLHVFGDNLYVDLDLSAANLPTGTRLAVGEAEVEVTPEPHDGCKKFNARFGSAALRLVQAPATRRQNYRGIYWKTVVDGTIRVGSVIRVLSRPPVSAA